MYTLRTLPVFSLYTVQGVYRESTGTVQGVYRECTGSIECALSIYGHMCNAQSRRGILSEAMCVYNVCVQVVGMRHTTGSIEHIYVNA